MAPTPGARPYAKTCVFALRKGHEGLQAAAIRGCCDCVSRISATPTLESVLTTTDWAMSTTYSFLQFSLVRQRTDGACAGVAHFKNGERGG
jgi:hypothetical protein